MVDPSEIFRSIIGEENHSDGGHNAQILSQKQSSDVNRCSRPNISASCHAERRPCHDQGLSDGSAEVD
jgi:hypothetical protein